MYPLVVPQEEDARGFRGPAGSPARPVAAVGREPCGHRPRNLPAVLPPPVTRKVRTVPKSPTKRRPITLASLADSALALFTERGFHATSISDIVQRAGLTRGAFYSNYRDKEELFLALYDARTDALLAGLREAAARLEPGQDPVDRFLAYIAGRTPQERQWFLVSMEFTLHAARNPAVAEALAAHEERLVRGLSEIFEETLARDGLRPVVATDDLTRLVMALSRGLTAVGLVQGAHAGTRDLAARVAPRLLSALTTTAVTEQPDGRPRHGHHPGEDDREDDREDEGAPDA